MSDRVSPCPARGGPLTEAPRKRNGPGRTSPGPSSRSGSGLGDPVKILQAQHDAEGVVLNARTTTPGWLGERLDVGWAIDVLHPLAGNPG